MAAVMSPRPRVAGEGTGRQSTIDSHTLSSLELCVSAGCPVVLLLGEGATDETTNSKGHRNRYCTQPQLTEPGEGQRWSRQTPDSHTPADQRQGGDDRGRQHGDSELPT